MSSAFSSGVLPVSFNFTSPFSWVSCSINKLIYCIGDKNASMEIFAGEPKLMHMYWHNCYYTIKQLISEYKTAGVNRIVALRGDMPSGMGGSSQLVYANELVAFIREHFGNHFHLEVAAYPEIHPEAKTFSDDIGYLKGKFDAGANSAITQYFFNPDAYFYFMEQCQKAGIKQPIYPGIMPILNYKNLARFSSSCGAEIPRWLRKALENYGDDEESLRAFGVDMITELSETLLENGAPGLHFYTMNQTDPTATIVRNLGLDPAAG